MTTFTPSSHKPACSPLCRGLPTSDLGFDSGVVFTCQLLASWIRTQKAFSWEQRDLIFVLASPGFSQPSSSWELACPSAKWASDLNTVVTPLFLRNLSVTVANIWKAKGTRPAEWRSHLQAVFYRTRSGNIFNLPEMCCLIDLICKHKEKCLLTAERNAVPVINKTPFL